MYGNYRNKKRPYKGKNKKTATQKAYSAGFKAGLRYARQSRSKRW